ncbi:MAG: hydroxyectoine utilization dehydratase EutB [SAR324 cluster bacterium]|nr:hydroxyectoine utilization dehydratase EutB [SAR324 cluster bacterium]
MNETWPVNLSDIEKARETIKNVIRTTMVNPSAFLTEMSSEPTFLKLEHQQVTGSFKLRGSSNAVMRLSKEQKSRGVVGVSTGNHGRGLAYAARQNGVHCIICMSNLVPKNKIAGIEAQGAEVRIIGSSQDDAQIEVDRLVSEEGMTMIPPFDHPHIISGQGTLGLELLEQLPDMKNVLVPLSGGGLIVGMALALKAKKPDIRVIGVSMERGAAMYECLRAGKPIEVKELPTLADSLGGGIGLENQYTFKMAKELVDEIVLVSETEIAEAIRHIYWQEQQIVEGSGSVGVAALLANKVKLSGMTVALLSGGNIDMNLHHRLISGENVNLEEE